MAEEAPVRVENGSGSYFHVGDIVRRDGKPMEVTVVSAHSVLVVRASWWRRVWSWLKALTVWRIHD